LIKKILRTLGLLPRLKQPVSVTVGFRKNRSWISSVDHDEYGTWYLHDHVYDAEIKEWAEGLQAFLKEGGSFKDHHVPAPEAGYEEMELAEVLKIDPSLEDLVRALPKGWTAERTELNGPWTKEIDENAQFTDRKAAVG